MTRLAVTLVCLVAVGAGVAAEQRAARLPAGAGAGSGLVAGDRTTDPSRGERTTNPSRSAGSDVITPAGTEWRNAARGRAIELPADHASHPDYKIEWWYYTGNLDTADGRRYGYQLTFFRIGMVTVPASASRWAVRDLFMAHFAITDVNGRRYRFAERMNRSGPGWAGASSSIYHVWNEDWDAALNDGSGPPLHRLVAKTGDMAIDLELGEGRPAALHGDRGYSQKGAAPTNASHYYSLTRMPTRGTITLDGRSSPVSGSSWMDHEFGTSFLEPEQRGWDWFSLQLSDGRDLMIFQMRRDDGSIDPRSSGTLIAPDGRVTPIMAADRFTLEPRQWWTSPASGARYPVSWHVLVPTAGLDLTVRAALDDQELHTPKSSGISYWEGAIDVEGRSGDRPVTGRGYLEMTGYSGAAMGTLLK